MNAQTKFGLESKPSCVLADGPEETDGDGGYEYTVCFGDEDGEPITENPQAVWHLWEYEEVWRFAFELGRRYGLEVVNEAMAV
jgi:hypothetical protein